MGVRAIRRGLRLLGRLSSPVARVASASDAVGDASDLVQLTRRDLDDEFVRLVVRQGQVASIDAQEGDRGSQSQSLIPVDQRVVSHQRMQQGGGLLLYGL